MAMNTYGVHGEDFAGTLISLSSEFAPNGGMPSISSLSQSKKSFERHQVPDVVAASAGVNQSVPYRRVPLAPPIGIYTSLLSQALDREG
jgi:hypothetical protein